jgi:hypothetical protein
LNLQTSAFKPAWWLSQCHLQTIYPALYRKPPTPPNYRRERLTTPDQDFIDIDFCVPGQGPLVILLHGLTGSSKSSYIMGLQNIFAQLGWRSAALNFRGCSGQPNNTVRSYHSGDTFDLNFLYQTLRQREPQTPIAAVGFSLGGNVLLKWLGEQQQNLDLFAAAAVSTPLVLSICSTKLDNGFAKIYRGTLLKDLKNYLHNKLQHLENIGQFKDAEKITALGDVSAIQSFWEYDGHVVAKLYGFKDAQDYYQQSSARQFLKTISVPTLLIQALDDPFMTPAVLPTADEISDQVQLEFSAHGGHVGFISGCNPFKPEYWLEQRIPAFFQACLVRTQV